MEECFIWFITVALQLVDIVHPQQEFQVEKQIIHSAFVQFSLYQPTLVFGISSNQKLGETEWEEIWQIQIILKPYQELW